MADTPSNSTGAHSTGEPIDTGSATNAIDPVAQSPMPIEDDEAGADLSNQDEMSSNSASGAVEFAAAERAGGDDVQFTPDPTTGGGSGTGGAAESGSASGSTVQTLKDQAGKFGQQGLEGARGFVDQGKERASGALDEVSKLLHDAAGQVDEKLGQQYGQYARSAADTVSGLSESLRNKDVDELMEDARGFVRSSPAVAIGAAAAIGFVVARLLKSGIDAAGDTGPSGSRHG